MLGNKRYPVDLSKELSIDRTNLDTLSNDLIHQPARFAWYAVLYAMAKNYTRNQKHAMELCHAQVDRKVRKKKIKDKLTEPMIKARVLLHFDYLAAIEDYNDAKYNEDLLNAAVDAFIMRKDVLQSVSTNMRIEVERGLRTASKNN